MEGKPMKDSAILKKRTEELQILYQRALIGKIFGMKLSFDDRFRAVFDLPFNPELCHGIGDVHGGVISTLLDNAGWFTIAPYYSTWISTVDLYVQLLEPARKEHLKSFGSISRLGKSLAFAQMEVKSVSGRLIATGSGTFSVTSVPFDLSKSSAE